MLKAGEKQMVLVAHPVEDGVGSGQKWSYSILSIEAKNRTRLDLLLHAGIWPRPISSQ